MRFAIRTPLIGAISTVLLLLSGCDSDHADGLQIPVHPVKSVAVERQSAYALSQEFTGTVAAGQHDDIGFELDGTINAIHVREGDSVGAGDLLAELDTQLLEIQRSELQAQLEELAARLRLNQSNLGRQKSLKASGFSAEQRLDELQAEQEVLAASEQRLRASLATVATRLDKSRLRAPFDAVISRRYRDSGAVVGAGTPVLRVLERGVHEASIGVPAPLVERVVVGQERQVRVDGRELGATIEAIGADMDPLTRTVSVRLRLPEQAGLFEGQLVRLPISEERSQDGTWLPATALTDGLRGLWVVYALVPTEQGLYRVEVRDVEVFHEESGRVFVNGALADGELVIAAGLHRFAPGQTVRLAGDAPA